MKHKTKVPVGISAGVIASCLSRDEPRSYPAVGSKRKTPDGMPHYDYSAPFQRISDVNDTILKGLDSKVGKIMKPNEAPLRDIAFVPIPRLPIIEQPGANRVFQRRIIVNGADIDTILRTIPKDIVNISKHDLASFRDVYTGEDPNQKERYFVKISTDLDRARIEAALTFEGSKDQNLNGIIVEGAFPKPLQDGNKYITLQRASSDISDWGVVHYIAGLAKLAVHAEKILKEQKVAIPEYEYWSFEQVLEDISDKDAQDGIRRFKNDYTRVLEELQRAPRKVTQADAKPDNFFGPYVGDLEGVCKVAPEYAIGQLLAQTEGTKDWEDHIKGYFKTVREEKEKIGEKVEFTLADVKEFATKARRFSKVACLKEYAGIHSRPMGDREKGQAEQIIKYLLSE